MTSNITKLLKRLGIADTGRYENHFYIVNIDDSNSYARMYTNLEKTAINTEFPDFETNSNQATTRVTNYFEVEENNIAYNIFLIADFKEDKYYLKIGER